MHINIFDELTIRWQLRRLRRDPYSADTEVTEKLVSYGPKAIPHVEARLAELTDLIKKTPPTIQLSASEAKAKTSQALGWMMDAYPVDYIIPACEHNPEFQALVQEQRILGQILGELKRQ